MATSQPLLQDKCDYALVFCNPEKLDLSRNSVLSVFAEMEKVSEAMVRKHFCRVFKTTEKEEDSSPLLKEFKEKLGGLFRERKELDFPTFANFVLQCILQVLQEELHLNVKQYLSADKSVVFCEIKASEEALKTQASLISYKLQFKHLPDEDEQFQQVPPYGPFPPSVTIALEQQFKHYNGSLFSDVDRIRLIASMFDRKFEIPTLHSLGILLSEEYCSEGHSREDGTAPYRKSEVSDQNQLRMQYGDQTAMLYCWFPFYLAWLRLPALIGCIIYGISLIIALCYNDPSLEMQVNHGSGEMIILYSLFLSVFSFIIDALWSRLETILAWQWGTIELNGVETQRPQFEGHWAFDKVTGQMRKQRQRECVTVFKKTISFGVIVLLLTGYIGILAIIFAYRMTLSKDNMGQQFGGSVLTAVVSQVTSFLCKFVVRRMNDWENIEFETEYYNALCTKLFVFQFVTSYASLFYIAFFKRWVEGSCSLGNDCEYELVYQLNASFLTFFIFKVVKLLWLRIVRRVRKRKMLNQYSQEHDMTIQTAYKEMPKREFKFTLDTGHDSPLEEHMDFVIMYGYVLMFSAVSSYSAMFMLIIQSINNAWTLKVQELFRRRPFPHPAKGVGVWNDIIVSINLIGAFTNPAVIIFTADIFDEGEVGYSWLILVVFTAARMLLKIVVDVALPKVPKDVEMGLVWGKRIAQERLISHETETRVKERNMISRAEDYLQDASVND